MSEFLGAKRSSPEEIRTRAEEVLGTKISLTPDQIQDLANKVGCIKFQSVAFLRKK